ncbi:hypothetical protein [Streptomyces sp. NPDC001970]
MLWLLAARGDSPEFRRPGTPCVAGTALCAVVLAASAALPADLRVLTRGLWAGAAEPAAPVGVTSRALALREALRDSLTSALAPTERDPLTEWLDRMADTTAHHPHATEGP